MFWMLKDMLWIILAAIAVVLFGISLLMSTMDERKKFYKDFIIVVIGLGVVVFALHWFGLF
jgi:hypothetical protein